MEQLVYIWVDEKRAIEEGIPTRKISPIYKTSFTDGSLLINIDTAIFLLAIYFEKPLGEYHFDLISELFNAGNVDGKEWTTEAIKKRFRRFYTANPQISVGDTEKKLMAYYEWFYKKRKEAEKRIAPLKGKKLTMEDLQNKIFHGRKPATKENFDEFRRELNDKIEALKKALTQGAYK